MTAKQKMERKWARLCELYGSQAKAQKKHKRFEKRRKVKYPTAHKNYQKAERKFLEQQRKDFVKGVFSDC